MTTDVATVNGVTIDHQAVLKALKLDPRDPNTQALLVVCDRYGLDPLLKHMVLIQSSPYVTRDGYLAVAHRSGVFDGMEVLEQSDDGTHYVAKVAVFRKDMSHPFTFIGRFPKNKPMAKEYGPEMAVKVAEVQALRRAFNVTGIGAADERWDTVPDVAPPETTPRPALPPANVNADGEVLTATVRRPPPQGPQPFTEDNEKLVDADTRRAFVAKVTESGFDGDVLFAIVHRATKGRTMSLAAVTKDEWPRLEAVHQALLEGKLAESVIDGAVR
ncbi:MAG TPA: hypothetical protein VNL12_00140, partial [Iamia sp.]